MTDPATLTFRTATAADIPTLVALVQSAYRGDASRAGWTTEADLLDGQRVDADGIAADIARQDSQVIVAAQGDAIVACAHIEKRDGHGYFGMFAVSPAAQGGGLGKAVLAEAERIARDAWHCAYLRMTVIDVRDDLIAWYERRGFRRTGEHAPFPYGDPRFGIPKRDDLRFAWLEKHLKATIDA
ncbi:MAG TPA: GNAT family N-acetyltransferase [Rhodanobacteraceae bacterium]